MKIVITEKGTHIEGKGTPALILALLTEGIKAVMCVLMKYPNLDLTQSGFLIYRCVGLACDDVLEMTNEEENE